MKLLRKLMPKIIIALVLFIIPIGIQLLPDSSLQITENITHAASCSFGDFGCYTVNLLEIILINLTQFFVGIAGFILDFFLKFSIDSSSYRGSGFIEQGWEILRDFTNIVFIFSLLVIAFKLVLGQDEGAAKKTLIKTILLALTINFSLFGVFAVMDASNILAYTIYSKIEAPEINFDRSQRGGGFAEGQSDGAGSGTTGNNIGTPGLEKGDSFGETKSLSLALVQKVNPQRVFSELKEQNQDTVRLILMFIVAAINISFIILFLSVSLLMLGRTLGLMILAVLSPLAVASLALGSKGASIPYVGWNSWFPQLISLSFMAPVFLFFLYLTTLFSSITDNMQIDGAAGIVETIFKISLPMLTIFALIQLSKKVSTKMAGEIGGVINSYVQKTAGAAIGAAALVATGGTSAIAGGVGGIASGVAKLSGSKRAEKVAAGAKRISRKAAATRLDVSKIPGFKTFVGKEGASKMSSFSGKSVARHIQDKKKEMRENPIYKDETVEIQKAKIEEAKKKEANKADLNKTANDWANDLNKVKQQAKDNTAATKIEEKRNETKVNANGEPDPTSNITFEEFSKKLQEKISKAGIINISGSPVPPPGYLSAAPLPSSMSMADKQIKNGESSIQFEDRVIKQYDKDKKNIEKDIKDSQQKVKEYERDLNEAIASGNASKISTARAVISGQEDFTRDLEDKLENNEKDKDTFEKATSKKQKEMLSAKEAAYEGQAREEVAREYETNDKETADRIRNGKVKTNQVQESSK